MFINVTVGSAATRKTVMANTEVDTPATVFEQAGIDVASGTPSLNGVALHAGEMNQTFDELHIAGNCFLTSIVKADSAC